MDAALVHRIGRTPDPWQYPDWSRANPDRTFGNRFDDPNGEYRVLYAPSVPLGVSLKPWRVTVPISLCMPNFFPLGTVPPEWFDRRHS